MDDAPAPALPIGDDHDAETRLVERARAGDREALSALLDRQAPRAYRFAMRMCGEPEDAREVVQESLLAVARSVRDFRGGSSVSTWLFSIVRSFCIKQRRRRKFAPRELPLSGASGEAAAMRVADPGRTPEDTAVDREVGQALEMAIAALDPEPREILLLRDVEGLTAPEVAALTGLSVEAVKSRLHRARLQVRERVAPLLGEAAAPRAPSAQPCPDVLSILSQHEEGDISASQCAAMERHLEGCPRCRGACDSLRRTLALCRAAPAEPVPPELRARVQRAIGDVLSARR